VVPGQRVSASDNLGAAKSGGGSDPTRIFLRASATFSQPTAVEGLTVLDAGAPAAAAAGRCFAATLYPFSRRASLPPLRRVARPT